MGTRGPEGLTDIEAAFHKLAKALGSETSPEAIYENLEVLAIGLEDCQGADKRKIALAFVRGGGLPPLIRDLRGPAASYAVPDPDVPPSSISAAAVLALSQLLKSECGILAELKVAKGILLPLIDALRDAPTLMARQLAACALGLLARAQPKQRKAMAKAGVFELLFMLYHDVGEAAWTSSYGYKAGVLASELLGSRMIGARALEREIRALGPVRAFSALVILQDCLMEREDDVLGIAVDAGVVKAIVATLEHESPFCVAAAAGVLGLVMQAAGSRGPALIEANDAIPALVRVIKRLPRPGDPALFSYAISRAARTGTGEPIRFNDPAPLAVAGLIATARTNGMLDSFLRAGGVPAIVRLLRDTTCPVTLQQLLDLMTHLVTPIGCPRFPDRTCELADELHRAGICEVALQALKNYSNATRGRLLQVMFGFFTSLSDKHDPAAMAVLVRGDVVELTVNYMAEAPVDELGDGLGMLLVLAQDAEGRQRLGAQRLLDPLMKGIRKGLREARGGLLPHISQLVAVVFDISPGFLPAAAEANLTPDLVRILREICPTPPPTLHPLEIRASLASTLSCLRKLLVCDNLTHRAGTCKSAVDAGLVPPLIHLLNLRKEQICDEQMMQAVLGVVSPLVLANPCNRFLQWGGGLPRAVAGLLKARPPLQPALAADTLFNFGARHRDMMLEYRSWGIDDSLKRLIKQSDPYTAGAAGRLLFLANEGRELSEKDLLIMVAHGVVPPQHSTTTQPAARSASTSSSTPYPSEDRQPRGPLPQRAPNPTAASTLDLIQRTPGGPQESTAGSHAKRDKGQPSGAPDLSSSREGTRCVGASPGRRVGASPDHRVGASPGRRVGASHGRRVGASPGASPGRRVGASPGRRLADTWACAHCKISDEALQVGKLKECSGCRSVRYCGKTCQKAHWPVHKTTCKRVQATRE